MKNSQNNDKDILTTDETRFLQLKYSIKEDYFNGVLTFDEMILFIWLQWQSNPINGKFFTSYTSLESELGGKYTKNSINKIMLSLKAKEYVWFPEHQGSRSQIQVVTKHYPLSKGHFLRIEKYFDNSSAEVDESTQKLQGDPSATTNTENGPTQNQLSRGSNTDTNTYTKTDTDNKTLPEKVSGKKLDPHNYIPKTYEEEMCMKIAIQLNEKDLRFLLSINKEHGIDVINQAWEEYKRIPKHKVDNPPAYFNTLVRKQVERR